METIEELYYKAKDLTRQHTCLILYILEINKVKELYSFPLIFSRDNIMIEEMTKLSKLEGFKFFLHSEEGAKYLKNKPNSIIQLKNSFPSIILN